MNSKSYLLSFAKAKGNIAAVALAAVLMAANATVASAQNKATENNGTENTIGGVDNLYGIDPSSAICADKGTAETDGNKIVCLYNVGAKKFLSVGGMWGTHASLDVSPYSIYMIWNKDSQTYFLESKVHGSKVHPYLGIDNTYGQVFMDTYDGEKSAIRFEQAKDYDSKTNKVYLVKIGKSTTLGYLTAYPDKENKLCDYQKTLAAEGTQEYKNQEWKVITKNEYYLLFNTNPAYMKSPVDASFLIACPDFRANNADATKWTITGKDNKLPEDWKSHMRFGDENMYKTHAMVENTGSNSWVNYIEAHQRDYGQYFYCYTKGLRGFTFYQDVKVHKAGWYLLRCNGFSTANSSESITKNGKPLANLFITVVDAHGNPINEKFSTATLNGISQADAKTLAQTHNGKNYDGAGIGHAFFEGEYENQVQICLDDDPNNKISDKNPVTLRIGFYVAPTPDGKPAVAEDELTAVDEFKLLYAGPRRRTELILDEDQTSLLYLTNAKDSYQNSVLHLNRTLKEGQWNSLILPVKLNFGQMKRTFGDDVKVAKLTSLKDGVVIFRTVEPKIDSDVMVEAFEPYIIKPTSLTKKLGLPYTAEKFYTSEAEDNNAFWLSNDCKRWSNDEKDRFSLTIPAGHYDILMVTLNRNELIKHLNLTEKEKTDYVEYGNWEDVNWNNVNWKSSTSFSTGAKEGDLTCYGTLTKTYKDNGNGKNVIIEGRDDLKGDYIMRDGKIMQVPSSKQYGLKGFRCWFEVKGGSSQAKPLRLEIDGTSDDATSIDEINSQPSQFTSRHKGISGVFNLDGQKVREGKSTQNLPKGIYIVNGRKVVVM